MNFWTPEFHVWGQGLDASDMPWFLLYDYVEVFTYDLEDNEFHFHWRDDFDTFDTERWRKANGGFEQNSSVFDPENVTVKAGNLVLKMEPLVHQVQEVVAPHRSYYDAEYDVYHDHSVSDDDSDHHSDYEYHVVDHPVYRADRGYYAEPTYHSDLGYAVQHSYHVYHSD